jgi:hypothetical protein
MDKVFQKLKLTPERTILLINAPTFFTTSLQEFNVVFDTVIEPTKVYDFVQLFVQSIAEFEQSLPSALTATQYDKMLWICYPKGSSNIKTDINRDRIHQLSPNYGIDTVTQISIDDTWSAMRLRPLEAVGKKAR